MVNYKEMLIPVVYRCWLEVGTPPSLVNGLLEKKQATLIFLQQRLPN